MSFRTFLTLLIALWTIPASAQKNPYRTRTLSNGLLVVAIEDPTVPLATIAIAVRTGSFTEPDSYAGLSHLYEHMFFKANRALPSQEAFMERIRDLGIVYNGYTTDEVVVYFFTLPSKNLDPGTRFMADAITSPLFKEDELVREREVVIGEFDRNEARPDFVLGYAVDSAVWMPYVSRKQPLGQRNVILTATKEKMEQIQKRFYIPNNAALIVSGDINAEEVFRLAEKYLLVWERGEAPFPKYSPPPFPPLTSKIVAREVKLPYATFDLTFHGPSLGKDDAGGYAMTLIETMMNQPTSRLYHRLIDSGLALRAAFSYSQAMNTSAVGAYLTATPAKARAAWIALRAELRAMASPGYFTPEEIAVAKEIVASRQIFEQDNAQRFAMGTTARWWSRASLDYYVSFPKNVAALTEQDIIRAIKTYIADRPAVLGVGAEQSVLDQLNIAMEDLP